MKNWKTTVGGVLFIGGKIAQVQSDPVISMVGHALEAISVAWLGYHAVDKG